MFPLDKFNVKPDLSSQLVPVSKWFKTLAVI
jgi:hypothetical protein